MDLAACFSDTARSEDEGVVGVGCFVDCEIREIGSGGGKKFEGIYRWVA